MPTEQMALEEVRLIGDTPSWGLRWDVTTSGPRLRRKAENASSAFASASLSAVEAVAFGDLFLEDVRASAGAA